jgi:hypothetical protein
MVLDHSRLMLMAPVEGSVLISQSLASNTNEYQTDEAAMQPATVTQDVPGLGVQGISLATSTEFEMKVQMPAGMTCDATVAGTPNVCVMRVRNGAAAGPFGGSVAFTQGAAARKRAVAYRLKKRMEIARKH